MLRKFAQSQSAQAESFAAHVADQLCIPIYVTRRGSCLMVSRVPFAGAQMFFPSRSGRA